MPMGRLQYESIGTAYLGPIFDGEHIGSAAAHKPIPYVYHRVGGETRTVRNVIRNGHLCDGLLVSPDEQASDK